MTKRKRRGLNNLMIRTAVLNSIPGIDADYLASAFYDTSLAMLYQNSTKTTPVTAAADPIGAWVDSVSGYDWTMATAGNRPTFRASPNRAEFDGSSDIMSSTAVPALFNGTDTAWTVIVACNPTTITGTHEILHCDGAGTAFLEIRIQSSLYNIFKRDDSGANVSVSSGASTATTGDQLLVFAHSGTTTTIRKNGVVLVNETAQNVGSCAFTVTSIGRRADVGGAYFVGSMERIAVYNSRLSNDDIALIESKWNSDLGLY